MSVPSTDPKDILISELTHLLIRILRRHVPKDHTDYTAINDYISRKNLASPLRASHHSSYICGYATDKGQPGRCTPGDDRCNNYCNLAPEKGRPMADSPMPAEQEQ